MVYFHERDLCFNLLRGMPDSQRYSGNLDLINIIDGFVIFLALKVTISSTVTE